MGGDGNEGGSIGLSDDRRSRGGATRPVSPSTYPYLILSHSMGALSGPPQALGRLPVFAHPLFARILSLPAIVLVDHVLRMAAAPSSGGSSRPSGQPKPPVVVPGTGNNIIVNPCQVRATSSIHSRGSCRTARESDSGKREERWEGVWGDTGGLPGGQNHRRPVLEVCRSLPSHCVLGIPISHPCSLRYHRLHPEYIHQRIEKLGHAYNLRVLLLMCDVVRTHLVPPAYCGFDRGLDSERASRANT